MLDSKVKISLSNKSIYQKGDKGIVCEPILEVAFNDYNKYISYIISILPPLVKGEKDDVCLVCIKESKTKCFVEGFTYELDKSLPENVVYRIMSKSIKNMIESTLYNKYSGMSQFQYKNGSNNEIAKFSRVLYKYMVMYNYIKK